MRQLLLCLLSFLFITTNAQISKKNNFLLTKPSTELFKVQKDKNNGADRVARSVQISKTIQVPTAGTLNNLLTHSEKNTVTDLTVTGNLDARDFKIIRDSILNLAKLDLSSVNILTYSGTEGSYTSQSVTYPANEIPSYSFCNMNVETPNTTLSSIIFPLNATSIGEGAFGLCKGFNTINIPSTITKINVMAFVGFYGNFTVDTSNPNYSENDGLLMDKLQQQIIQCPALKDGNYVIPSTVKTIGQYAFYGCNILNSVTLPSSIVSIGDFGFYNCTGLTTLTINNRPDKITLGNYCFYDIDTYSCVLHIPFGTKTLFQNDGQWNSFTNILENEHGFVLSMSSMLFSNKNSTGKLAIISNDAWNVLSDQTWLTIDASSGIGNDTIHISTTENLTTTKRTGTLTFSVPGFESQTVTIIQSGLPKEVNITAGGLYATITAPELSSVINLKISGTIDARDFRTMRDYMPNLTFLDLGDVTIAAYNGILGTTNGSAMYPSNAIPDNAFYKINNGYNPQNLTLSSIKLPTTISSIGIYAFYSCEALNEIVIPNSVSNIGNFAFGSCNTLTSITLSNTLTTIGTGAFIGDIFSTITIPNTVSKIGSQAFASCSKLSSVNIPNSLTTIESSVFQDCISLESMDLGNSLISIGTSAFNNCVNLKTLIIPNSMTLLDNNAFSGCVNLDSVRIGNSVTTIGASCFQNCPKLSKIRIPDSVTKIGTYGFVSCTSLANISFGNGLKTIDSYAFSNCTGLSSIIVDSETPADLSSSYGVFTGVNITTCLLHVPFGAKNTYSTSSQWKDFSNIIENTQGFSLESNTVKLSYADGSKTTIKITSNNQWIVSSGQTWLKVSPPIGTGNNLIVLTADQNTSILTRTAIVTVTADGVAPKSITVIQAASPKIVNIVAGGLATALTADELNTLSSLTITGTIDSRDFKTMRDNMPQLAYLDINAVNILAYNGSLGTTYYNYANTIPNYAFCSQNTYVGKTSLVSVMLPLSATSIESSAFQSCIGLNNITIPNTITNIGYGAFSGCSGLKDIVLPTGITKIQASTFQNCTNLKNITIPNSVITIEYSVFQSCAALDSIVIPNSVTTIGTGVFASCGHLTRITLPNALTKMDGTTFSNCTSLQSITIPNTVTAINYSTFLNCSSLKTVNIGSGVKYIGYSAFESCISLSNISIPSSVTSFESDIFKNCTSLSTVSLANSLTTTGSGTFYGCTSLKEITLPVSLKKIETNTFYNCSSLTKVNIPNSIKSIADNAFYNCTTLNSITLPNSVNTLGYGTFSGCLVLSDISLGDSLVTIGSRAFEGCIALKSITLPSTLTKIDSYSFSDCKALTDVVIPNSVSTIGSYAFINCSGLVSITISNYLKSIESYTFSKCSKLTNVNIGNQVTSIGDMAFESCTSLPSITLPSSLKTIGNSAFYNCTSLLGIAIPNSVISIAPWAFQSCSGLTNATLSNTLKIIDSSIFYNCSRLTGIVIPNSVTSIGSNAFFGCSALATVTMGNYITTINGNAFNGCNKLTAISIPGSVTSIGYSAFDSCIGLKSITVNALIPVNLTNSPAVFNNVDKTICSLYVPFHTKSAYAVANQWKDFINIVENPYGLVLDTDSLNLSVKAGSNATINILSNTFWSASSDKSWLTVTPNSGTGSYSIIATAEANSLLTTRTAIITVEAAGIEPQYVTVTQDAATKTVTVSAGGLSSALTHNEHTLLNRLTINGTLDASDFRFMRDSIPNLAYLDITQTIIAAYTGANGTGATYSINYPASTIPQYAFYNSYNSTHNNVLKFILLPNTLSSIGYAAFEYCSKLDSIAIPNSVASMGDYSFNSCINLKNVNISGSITTLGSIFGNCPGLTKIVIPNTVTSLTGSTFYSCRGLKSVTLSNSLKYIGGYAFYNCTGITNISIPNTVTQIGSSAFTYCTGLVSVTMGSKVDSIGMSAFSGCTSLTEVVLPKSVETIGDYAFQGCSLLSIVTIPANVSYIGSYAFSCSGLKSILSAGASPFSLSNYGVFSDVNKSTCTLYVPTGSKALYQNAAQWKDFSNISEEFGFMLSNETVRILSGGSITIDIPTTKTFTAVSNQPWLQASIVAGNGNTHIVLTSDINPDLFLRTAVVKFSFVNGPSQQITVIQSGTPKTVSISSGGLYKSLTADELKNISNLILTGTIDARDFRVMRDSMPQLADIDIKNTSITAYSGSEGTNPSIYSYPSNETPINSFYKTYSGVGKPTLASIKLPTNITSIGKSSFAYASGLSSIIIPDQVTVINETAFARCEGLKDLTIGKSVTIIGIEAFWICTNLSGVAIPNSVTTLSAEAFSNCSSLKWATFPTNLKILDNDAFASCKSLVSVELPNTITTFGNDAFYGCTSLTKANIPNTITELKSGIFEFCSSLKEIIIPASVKTIGSRAFGECPSLTTISIPASVTKMDYGIFEYCTGLTSIYANQTIPIDLSASYYALVFNNVNKTVCKLYVPIGSKQLYSVAVEWKDFTNIIDMPTDVPTLLDQIIRIYPNPVKDSFSVTGLNETVRLILTDINGKEVLTCQVGVGENIPVSSLPKGMYILRLITSNGNLERKLIKE